jgi:hypothetical protein
MLIKKEEIGKKLCPIKFIHPPIITTCEGENCMAWRIYVHRDRGEFGYCGLAGMPVDVQVFLTSISKRT